MYNNDQHFIKHKQTTQFNFIMFATNVALFQVSNLPF